MDMGSVWSLVFFGIMEVGCQSSCARSKSQADKGEIPEQNPQHEVIWTLCHTPTQLQAGSPEESNCQERLPLNLVVCGDVRPKPRPRGSTSARRPMCTKLFPKALRKGSFKERVHNHWPQQDDVNSWPPTPHHSKMMSIADHRMAEKDCWQKLLRKTWLRMAEKDMAEKDCWEKLRTKTAEKDC